MTDWAPIVEFLKWPPVRVYERACHVCGTKYRGVLPFESSEGDFMRTAYFIDRNLQDHVRRWHGAGGR